MLSIADATTGTLGVDANDCPESKEFMHRPSGHRPGVRGGRDGGTLVLKNALTLEVLATNQARRRFRCVAGNVRSDLFCVDIKACTAFRNEIAAKIHPDHVTRMRYTLGMRLPFAACRCRSSDRGMHPPFHASISHALFNGRNLTAGWSCMAASGRLPLMVF